MQGKGTRGRSAQGRARSRVNAGERNAAPRPFGGGGNYERKPSNQVSKTSSQKRAADHMR